MHARRPWFLLFLLTAFLVARVTGAHLHLCFDGSEPLAQLHVTDSAKLDHHSKESDAHDDVDVDALGSVLAKVFKIDLPAIVFVAWCLALVLVAKGSAPPARAVRASPARPPPFLRPLLRGPPL